MKVLRAVALGVVCGVGVCGVAQTADTPGSVAAQALMLDGVIAEWHATADGRDFKLVKQAVDKHLTADGVLDVTGADAVAMGVPVVALYRVTLDARYWKAATAIHDGLASAKPASPEEQYFAATFLAAYTATAHEGYADVKQGLSLPDTSAWRLAALVDALSYLPASAAERASLIEELKVAAEKTSASGVVAERLRSYALLKAVRMGLLPQKIEAATLKSATKLRGDVSVDAKGQDLREAGAAMLLSSELDQSATALAAQGKTVGIDAWFNSQMRKGPNGADESFHYKWDDDANSGFSFFGRAFERYGAKLTVVGRPTAASLKGVKVYVIASPDIPSKNPKPNYADAADAEAIAAWVNAGGVLLVMQNDGTNAEFEHFNAITERFGIHLNPVLRNTVEGNKFEQGKVVIPAGTTGVFHDAHNAYMKEICTISTQAPAVPVLRDMLHNSGEVYMAVAKYGKGTVYAVVDPWLYNEYTDGRKLPAEWDQFASAKDLARWALEQAK
jgi:unsaturated rhamnogalacturonyl hydrolase